MYVAHMQHHNLLGGMRRNPGIRKRNADSEQRITQICLENTDAI